MLVEGIRVIEYNSGLQKQALQSIERIVNKEKKPATRRLIADYMGKIDDYCDLMVKQFREAVNEKASEESVKIVKYVKKEGPWEREAASIIPKRIIIGTLTLEGIPVEEWKEISSSPRWWGAKNWASASYFWCDGKRNLNDIKELIELEAGVSVTNFDLISYYRFLEKYDMVEFVE